MIGALFSEQSATSPVDLADSGKVQPKAKTQPPTS